MSRNIPNSHLAPWPSIRSNARLSSLTGGSGVLADPLREGTSSSLSKMQRPQIMLGTVIKAGAITHDCVVSVDGKEVVCVMSEPVAGAVYGATMSSIPTEGSLAIIALMSSSKSGQFGVVLGIVPLSNFVDPKGVPIKSKTKWGGPNPFSIKAYSQPLSNHKDKKINSSARRPLDMMPGDFAITNENDCGLTCDILSATLSGGTSYVQADRMDNMVRIVCRNFQNFNSMGGEEVWSDNSAISEEISKSMYQGERFGVDTRFGGGHNPTSKPRYRSFFGYFGNLFTSFFCRAKKKLGVFKLNIDGSGKAMVRSAGGIALERYDRIPVTTRLKAPWDPTGEKDFIPVNTTPFQYNPKNPYFRQLELVDALAWEYKNSYKRFDEYKKDFDTPEEPSTENAPDVIDDGDKETNSVSVKLESNKARRCGIYLGEDGSVILRDAWGSEIVMMGGNVDIRAAGNINILSGKTSLIMGGDDAVVKGYNSVDINATNKDVRIKAEHNMQIVSGSDENTGGITLQAIRKKQMIGWSAEGVDGGEDLRTNGILLKADDTFVGITSKYTKIRGDKYVELYTDEGRDGMIFETCKQHIRSAKQICDVTEGSATILSKRTAAVVSEGTAVVGGVKSAFLVKEGQAPLLIWLDADVSVQEIIDKTKEIYDKLQDSEVDAPCDKEQLKNMKFVYRNSQQCGTTTQSETVKYDVYTMYQPYWKTMKDYNPAMVPVAIDTWSEITIDGKCTWPGKETWFQNGKYATVSPTNMISQLYSKTRDSLQDTSNVSTTTLNGSYLITK